MVLASPSQLVFACNLGCWLPFSGLFFDSRWGGPLRTVLMGAVLNIFGYGGLWFCSAHPQHSSFGLLWFFWFLWWAVLPRHCSAALLQYTYTTSLHCYTYTTSQPHCYTYTNSRPQSCTTG